MMKKTPLTLSTTFKQSPYITIGHQLYCTTKWIAYIKASSFLSTAVLHLPAPKFKATERPIKLNTVQDQEVTREGEEVGKAFETSIDKAT